MQSWKAIILASGRGERCSLLTDDMNKVLLDIHDKSIIEWTLDSLSEIKEVKEIIIAVDYKKEQIIEKISKNYKGKPIKYVKVPHLPKHHIDKEHSKDNAGMDLEEFREKRNRLEYAKAIYGTAINDSDFENIDYYLRFNGDVLFDKKSVNKFIKKVRKDYDVIEALLFSAYKPKLIKTLWEVYKTNKWNLVKLNNKYLTKAFYEKTISFKTNKYDYLKELLENIKDSDYKKEQEDYLEENKQELEENKAFITKQDFEEMWNLFDYLHKNQHVDTVEDYERLKKNFS